jgi:hypothetical protein
MAAWYSKLKIAHSLIEVIVQQQFASTCSRFCQLRFFFNEGNWLKKDYICSAFRLLISLASSVSHAFSGSAKKVPAKRLIPCNQPSLR